MEDTKFKKDLVRLIETELEGNLMVLIDPKKKDSFSQARINTWRDLVSERILRYIDLQLKNKNK
tara:strand:- start:349 stop:540 length:192 start_codon:yes stop_codon:yes gene_type:complete